MPHTLSATRTRTSIPPTAADRRPSALMVTALRAAEQHVLVVVGEADLHTAAQLRTQLIDMLPVQPPSVLVDLGALEFCDLPGLDALHDAARAAHDAGVALTFRGMSAQLTWLHRTFPPRSPVPPPSAAGLARPASDTSALSARSTPATAPAPDQPGDQKAATTRRPATAGTPAAPPARPRRTSVAQRPTHPTELTDARRSADPRRSVDAPSDYLTARGGGRRGAPDRLVHAVPVSDTTRSAVCGARTWPATTSWTGAAPDSCRDCAAAVAASAVGTVHPFPAPRPTAITLGAQDPSLAQQVS